MKDRIIYVYDTLCGWCHVVSPIIDRIYDYAAEKGIAFEHYHSRFFTENNIPEMNNDFLDKIKRVGKKLAPKMTGITFSDEYIELCSSEDFVYHSNLTSLGVAAAKILDDNGAKTFMYSKRLQESIFQYGKNPNDLETILNAADEIYYLNDFNDQLKDAITRKNAINESVVARELGYRFGEKGIPYIYYYKDSDMRFVKLDPFDFDKTLEMIEKGSNNNFL